MIFAHAEFHGSNDEDPGPDVGLHDRGHHLPCASHGDAQCGDVVLEVAGYERSLNSAHLTHVEVCMARAVANSVEAASSLPTSVASNHAAHLGYPSDTALREREYPAFRAAGFWVRFLLTNS